MPGEEAAVKRKDKARVMLRKGEYQRPNGTYRYRWVDKTGKEHNIYAKTLDELRTLEDEVTRDNLDGIRAEGRNMTVNDAYAQWCELKRGLKDHTFRNYDYMYRTYVQHSDFGNMRIASIHKSDVKRYYNWLIDERHLKESTVDNIHTVLRQVFQMAVDDNLIRHNPADDVLKEVKQAHSYHNEPRRALTAEEQELFLNYLKNSPQNRRWYPIFFVMCWSGMRVGEITGLRWCDINLSIEKIDIGHTLVYYDRGEKMGYTINSTKTPASERTIPMFPGVKDAFLEEKQYQQDAGIVCKAEVDGYTDFIFLNRFGLCLNNSTLNKVIRRIIRDCNDEILNKDPDAKVLLPHFSCHSLRHSFTTRMIEAGVNVKVLQEWLGHAEVSTTLDIYADVTEKMHAQELTKVTNYLTNSDAEEK